jgi:hypothetical protein
MTKKHPDTAALYQRKEAGRKFESARPVSEKMATVERLREVERALAPVRRANKALREAKAVKILIKTR